MNQATTILTCSARLKELEDENRRLKKMYAEERLKAEIVQEALQKKW
jgi:putative transposase